MSSRRGISLMELIVACGLLATLVSVLTPVLQGLAQARTALAQRELGLRELRNLAEQGLAGQPPDALKLSSHAERLLTHPALEIVIVPEPGAPLDRIRMRLSWEDATGQSVAPIELCWWRPRAGEGP